LAIYINMLALEKLEIASVKLEIASEKLEIGSDKQVEKLAPR